MLKSLENRSLLAVLPVAFALVFAIPLLIFFSVAITFDLIKEQSVQLAIIFYIAVSLLGYMLLREIVDRIIGLAKETAAATGYDEDGTDSDVNELHHLADRFNLLMRRLEENTTALEQRITELAALHEITEISGKIANTAVLFETVLTKAMATTGSTAGAVMTLTADGAGMKLEAAHGIREHFDPGTVIGLGDSIAGRAITENRTLAMETGDIEEDARNDALFNGAHLLLAPIRGRDVTVGVLAISRPETGPSYRDYEAGYIETMLGNVASAIDNARLIENLRTANENLKRAQDKMIELERAAAVSQTVVTLSDKINNPLTVIRGTIDLIRKNLRSEDEKLARSLEKIDNSVVKCTAIMEKLQNLPAVRTTGYADGSTLMIDIGGDAGEAGQAGTGANSD
ncbi:MAG: GAF domain-containing protein [Candidatus Latescibacteria bacterium]|nr:GAF domain-containing protein [Candidatus Latescibacterota bacterium]